MNKNVLGGKNNPSRLQNFTSETIKFLRFPLAVMVVYIHSFGQPTDVDLLNIDWTAFNFSDLYNIIRITISRIISHCAVPIFFLIS